MVEVGGSVGSEGVVRSVAAGAAMAKRVGGRAMEATAGAVGRGLSASTCIVERRACVVCAGVQVTESRYSAAL